MLDCVRKILREQALAAWRDEMGRRGVRVVVTNGCFDLLHAGHAHYLETARNLGDVLLVGVNGDDAVRALKGPTRPLNPAADRALVIAALACVDAVYVFPEVSAAAFLAVAKPVIYVKGGDYTLDTLNAEERRVVEAHGGQIHLIPMVPGKSTTRLVRQLQSGHPGTPD